MNWYDRENEKVKGVPLSRVDGYGDAHRWKDLNAMARWLEESLMEIDRLRAENEVIRQDYNRLFDDLDKQLKETEELKQQQEAVARDAWKASFDEVDCDCETSGPWQGKGFDDWWASREKKEAE